MPLFFVCASAYAVPPNTWNENFVQGHLDYSLNDGKNKKLFVSCGDDGTGFFHSITLEMNNKIYENTDSKFPLTFLIDGAKKVAPSNSTKGLKSTKSWIDITSAMSKAKKLRYLLIIKKSQHLRQPDQVLTRLDNI